MIGGLRSREQAGAPPALAEWQAAEEQLSALAFAAPSEYERALLAVRRAADELRGCTTFDALTALWREPARRPRVDALAAPTVVGAAFLLRYREIVAAQRAEDVRRRIDAARAAGSAWAVLTDAPWPRGHEALRPCERVELRLADRTALRAVVELDADTYLPVYAVEVVAADGTTTSRQTYPDPTAWRAGFEETRRRLDATEDA